MDDTWDGAERRVNDPLLNQLRRVSSDLDFRNWTRNRFLIVALVIFLDLFASAVSLYAIHEGCRGRNQQSAAEVKLWTDLIAKNPTSSQQNPKQTQDFLKGLHKNFAQKDCLI